MTSAALKDNTALEEPKLDAKPSAYFDAEGRFVHNCEICGAPAYQGRDVNLREGRLGTWRCSEHLWNRGAR